jgi:tRNA A37 methylthiotransferase MiaB
MREKTHAHRKLQDDVPNEVKQARLVRMIETHQAILREKQKEEIGNEHLVFIDKHGKNET